MTASLWYPTDSTSTTANTTDWNIAATTTSTCNDTWHIRITFDTILDDDFGDCGGYIP